jgi:hypothetical protein
LNFLLRGFSEVRRGYTPSVLGSVGCTRVIITWSDTSFLRAERGAVSDGSDTFHRNPDKVRKVEFFHQPPGREHVRVTVEYVSDEVREHMVSKSLLAALLEELNPVEGRD